MRALLEQEELVSQLPGRIGHFRLESGHHSDLWIDLELLCLRPEFVRQRAAELAARLAPHHVEAVCGPLVEGAFVALLVAADLGVEFYYAERVVPQSDGQGAALFPVEYRLPAVLRERLRGKRVAIVNDVISAGSAVRGTFEDLQSCGATTVAVAALAVLGSSAAAFATLNNLALENLTTFPFTLWTPSECPLCQAGVAIAEGIAGYGRRPTLIHAAGVPLVRRARDRGVVARRERLPLARSRLVALCAVGKRTGAGAAVTLDCS